MRRTIAVVLAVIAVVSVLASCAKAPEYLDYGLLREKTNVGEGASFVDRFTWPGDSFHEQMLAQGKLKRSADEMCVVKIKPESFTVAVGFFPSGHTWRFNLISLCRVEEVVETGCLSEDIQIDSRIKIIVPVFVSFEDEKGNKDSDTRDAFDKKVLEELNGRFGDDYKKRIEAGPIELDLKNDYPEFIDRMIVEAELEEEQGDVFYFVPGDTEYYAVLDSLGGIADPVYHPEYSFENDKMLYYQFEPFNPRSRRDYKTIVRGFPADGSVLPQLEEHKNSQPDRKLSTPMQAIYDQNIRLYELINSGEKVLYGSD